MAKLVVRQSVKAHGPLVLLWDQSSGHLVGKALSYNPLTIHAIGSSL